MNNRKALLVQAIRGPILLITLGILFAVHQAGGLPIYRSWPLLIIVVGVMKLIERTAAPAAGAYPPPPSSGGPIR